MTLHHCADADLANARDGNQMVEIVGDAYGAILAFKSLGDALPCAASVASTERSSVERFAAVFAKFRTRLRGNCG